FEHLELPDAGVALRLDLQRSFSGVRRVHVAERGVVALGAVAARGGDRCLRAVTRRGQREDARVREIIPLVDGPLGTRNRLRSRLREARTRLDLLDHVRVDGRFARLRIAENDVPGRVAVLVGRSELLGRLEPRLQTLRRILGDVLPGYADD